MKKSSDNSIIRIHDIGRQLESDHQRCPLACQYCFVDLPGYDENLPAHTGLSGDSKFVAIYPSCDGELALNKRLVSSLKERFDKSETRTVICFSTKTNVSAKVREMLAKLDEHMRSEGFGFVKASISLSSLSLSKRIEPNALEPLQRVRVLAGLKSDGLSVSATIKPILPFVDDQEYLDLIQALSFVTGSIVTGGLYYSQRSKFAEEYSLADYQSSTHSPTWLREDPGWSYIDPSLRVGKWQTQLAEMGVLVELHSSDLGAVASAINAEIGRRATPIMVTL